MSSTFNPSFCPASDARTNEEIEKLIKALKEANQEEDRIKLLEKEVPKSKKVFKSDQVVKIMNVMKFSSGRVAAVGIMNQFILGFTCDDICKVLKATSFTNEKFEILEPLKETILDIKNKEKIIDCFSFSSDKETARKMLENIKPRNCIFGQVKEKVAVFVIDLSYSMEAKFKSPDGILLSRLDCVKQHLSSTISEQLQEYQKFNIISFSDGVYLWQKNAVNATSQNISSALQYIKNMKLIGGTNIWDSLSTAFKQTDVEGIYFLTDGMPSVGSIQNPDEIVKKVIQFNSSRPKPVKVYTTAFLAGSHCSDNKPKSKAFMNQLADATNGTYKCIEEIK